MTFGLLIEVSLYTKKGQTNKVVKGMERVRGGDRKEGEGRKKGVK